MKTDQYTLTIIVDTINDRNKLQETIDKAFDMALKRMHDYNGDDYILIYTMNALSRGFDNAKTEFRLIFHPGSIAVEY